MNNTALQKNQMTWLLKREMWEHKGALLWTPVAVATLFLVALLVGMGIAGHFLGGELVVSGQSLGSLMGKLSEPERALLVQGFSQEYISLGGPLFFVMALMVFFYSLGALSEERKDKSVLFWKSLPLSDEQVVTSKAFTGLLVAPLITVLVASALGVLGLFLTLCFGAFHGVSLFSDVLLNSNTYLAPLRLLALVPIYALWALPTVGWLMLVGALAPRKAFLWAVLLPVLAGVLVSWTMMAIGTHDGWFWEHVVARPLLSVIPGGWLTGLHGDIASDGFMSLLFAQSWSSLLSWEIWVGAVAGLGMLFAAARARRWKDEG